jgi:hypothetical protein
VSSEEGRVRTSELDDNNLDAFNFSVSSEGGREGSEPDSNENLQV